MAEVRIMRGNWLFKALDRYAGIPLVWLLGWLRKALRHMRGGGVDAPVVTQVLAIKLSALGDSILLIPALRKIKQAFPGVRLTVVCTRINEVVFKGSPYIDSVVVIDIGAMARNPLKIGTLFDKSNHYAIAFDFDQWTRLPPLLALASGAAQIIGFKTKGQYRHFIYDHAVEHRQGRHEIDCFLDLVSAVFPALGIEKDDRKLEFPVTELSKKRAIHILQDADIGSDAFVVFHPETPAHGSQRQWPPAYYIGLGKKIAAAYPEMKLLITGTGQDIQSNQVIAESIGSMAKVLPAISLPDYAAVLTHARGMVCGNTGVMHLAAALGIPLVALHGPTDPRKWGPVSDAAVCVWSVIPCSPCLYLGFEYGCSTNRCMQSIGIQEVYEALVRVLK